jgi:hypothetical protein
VGEIEPKAVDPGANERLQGGGVGGASV